MDDAALADQYEYVYTGGMGPLRDINPQTGDSCLVRTPDGSACLQYSTITKSASDVASNVAALNQTELNLATNGGPVTNDTVRRMTSLFMDRTSPPSNFQFSLNTGTGTLTTSTPTPPPTPTPTPSPGVTPDPACSGIPAACTCSANDSSAQAFATGAVQDAERRAMNKHPELLTADKTGVAPGMNTNFLTAVCAELGSTCSPRAGSQNEVVVIASSVEFSVNIITSTGVVRLPGQTIAVCPAGSL
jgi:hypothetical protein